ncbi:hypothetical protein cand_022940 [Cryptosporidium andersoni]|uniref:Uncharacterized protein n=1 Tax=Cryptosporidium andersoni TaxID=117008 RepID=A0A1J4MSA6_9CRYT|nr:hypothetical protein cand_022940 [Cryptosporidium andersoni]
MLENSQLHPLFRDEIPTKDELTSNHVYSALVEINSENSNQDETMFEYDPNNYKERSIEDITQDQVFNSLKTNKYNGKYQSHLERLKKTRRNTKNQSFIKCQVPIQAKGKTLNFNIATQKKDREISELEICMSLWSKKSF